MKVLVIFKKKQALTLVQKNHVTSRALFDRLILGRLVTATKFLSTDSVWPQPYLSIRCVRLGQ